MTTTSAGIAFLVLLIAALAAVHVPLGDYMYRVYAHDPQMRVNLGIRRRLAPLMGNNRRRIELLNGLLMALPGTPVIYYGDEIGLGDNVRLGDRVTGADGAVVDPAEGHHRGAGPLRSEGRERLCVPPLVEGGD